ncbi:hypothetical protein CTI14_52640, partial [Methylobacterium radiotolerans]
MRESEDSRYLGLTMPRYLLRQPYDPLENPVRSFAYEEAIDGDHRNYLWGNTAFLMGSRVTDSFAKFRWCPNIIGPQSGPRFAKWRSLRESEDSRYLGLTMPRYLLRQPYD